MENIFTHSMIKIGLKLPSIKSKRYNIKKSFSTIWDKSTKQTVKQYLLEQWVLFYKLVQTRSTLNTKRKTNVELSRKIFYLSCLKRFMNTLTSCRCKPVIFASLLLFCDRFRTKTLILFPCHLPFRCRIRQPRLYAVILEVSYDC